MRTMIVTAITLLAVLLSPVLLTGCDARVLPVEGTLEFIPADLPLTNATSSTSTQTISVLARDVHGLPRNGLDIDLVMFLHNHLPFASASGVVTFVDDDGNPLTITSPVGSSIQGTTTTVRTNSNGLAFFNVRFPFGDDYNIDIVARGLRTTSKLVIKITTNVPPPPPTTTPTTTP